MYLAFFLTLVGIGFLLANPISNQVQRVHATTCRISSTEANKQLATLQANLNNDGVHVQLIKQGKTALQTLQDKVAKSAGKLASFGGGLLTEAASAGFDLVLSSCCRSTCCSTAQQIGALVRRPDARRRRHDADDYPTLVQRAVSRYVGGQLLFSVIMGTTAGVSLYIFGVLGIFPDGRNLRARVRRLLRGDGADPLHRPDPRRDPAGPRGAVHRPDQRASGSCCCSSACSSSRGTSWRRRSSATRCASTRCS